MEALRLRGIAADLVTTDDDGPGRALDVPRGGFTEYLGHRVRFFRKQTDLYMTSWPMLHWLVRHVADYDAVHVHGVFTFAPNVGAKAAYFRGVPYILSVHNSLGIWGRENRRPLLKRVSLRLMEGSIIRRAARIHFASIKELEEASTVAAVRQHAVIIPLGSSCERKTAGGIPVSFEGLADKLRGRRVILYLSRIHPVKGLDVLLRAFAQTRQLVPDAFLLVAGDGEPHVIGKLRGLACEIGLENDVCWLGHVSGDYKNYLMSIAAVFVLPSWSENFGLAVVEALRAGIPVVASTYVPTAVLAAQSGGAVIYDGSVDQLKESLCGLLDNPQRAREVGAAGLLAAQDHFSLEVFGSRLERLYREVSSSRSSRVSSAAM
jgi:glycosyltransferase involved in cell wall biosynthesis